MERLNSGEKGYLQDHFVSCQYWSDNKMEQYNGKRRRQQEKISILY